MLEDRISELESEVVQAPIKKDDVLNEAVKNYNITEVQALTIEQVLGIIASRVKDVNQDTDEVTASSVGLYGLRIPQLQTRIVVKPHIANGDASVILNDSSVFTGREGITHVNDILDNENVQNKLLQETATFVINKLTQRSLLNNEGAATMAAVLGAAMKYSVDEIASWINGTDNTDINKVAKQAQYASALVDQKVADEIAKIQAGTNGAVVVVPTRNTGTVDDRASTKMMNAMINNKADPVESSYVEKDDEEYF